MIESLGSELGTLAGPAGAGDRGVAASPRSSVFSLSLFTSHAQVPGLPAQVLGNLVLVFP